MIQLTKQGGREFHYDRETDDYYYKDTGERVPDSYREGRRTIVFRQSSRRRIEEETPDQIQAHTERWEAFQAKMKAKYGTRSNQS